MGVEIAQLFFLCYFSVMFLSIIFGVWKKKTPQAKKKRVIWIISIFIGGPYVAHIFLITLPAEWRKIKMKPSQKIFDARCAMEEEKIYKTVEGVEGVLLPPPLKYSDNEKFNPKLKNAARYAEGYSYPHDFLDRKEPIGYFNDHEFIEDPDKVEYFGFSYVDIKEKYIITRYRYKDSWSNTLSATPSPAKPARYEIVFKDVDEPGDRKHRIAGIKATIIDTTTQEILAEKKWYIFALERSGSPLVWKHGRTCNGEYASNSPESTNIRLFVNKVLKHKGASQ